MEKFFRRLGSLDTGQIIRFVKGLELELWGTHTTISMLTSHALHAQLSLLTDQRPSEWVNMVRLEWRKEVDADTQFAATRKQLLNAFSHLNRMFERFLTTLPHPDQMDPQWTAWKVATALLDRGERGVAPPPADRMPWTEDEIEARLHFHRAAYNALVRERQGTPDQQAWRDQLTAIAQHNDWLHHLRLLRIQCAATNEGFNLSHPSPLPGPFDAAAPPVITLYQLCLRMSTTPGLVAVQQDWEVVFDALQQHDAPTQVTEHRELMRLLFNISIRSLNLGPDKSGWQTRLMRLFECAFAYGTLLESGQLPVQHMINYCKLCQTPAQVAKAHGLLAEFARDLAAGGRDDIRICQAILHYAAGDFPAGLKALDQYHPPPHLRPTDYMLRIKMLAPLEDDDFFRTLDTYQKWLRTHRGTLSKAHWEKEWQRVKLIQRLFRVHKGSKAALRKLHAEIRLSQEDQAWLLERFRERFGTPA